MDNLFHHGTLVLKNNITNHKMTTIMTDEQKRKLNFHVGLHKPISRMDNEEYFYINDGEIIEFTNIESYSANSKFELNHDPYHKIWFSQLGQFFFNSDIQLGYATIIIGGKEQGIYKFDDLCFWEAVKGKRFKVHTEGPYYIVNRASKTMVNQNIYNYQEIQEFIKKCINDNHIDEIGDLLKTATLYDLIEI